MHFGLKHVLEKFQRVRDVLLSKVKWNFALLYLDDTLTILQVPEEYIEQVWKVLKLLCDVG